MTGAANTVQAARASTATRVKDRLWKRWEFWPSWTMYVPLVPWIVWFAMRERSLRACMAVNPSIPMSGFAGESKSQILSLLPSNAIAKFVTLAPASIEHRLMMLGAFMTREGLTYPIVLKPDVGERGTGVRLIRNVQTAREYLQTFAAQVIAQEYVPGPAEVGVFYVRVPGQGSGQVFSTTLKHAPKVQGNGRATVEELIDQDPRLSQQRKVFLKRLGSDAHKVLAEGRSMVLAHAGNHCRGTLFVDGAWLVTPALKSWLDELFGQVSGVCFGRLDLRAPSAAHISQAKDLKIIEMNGLSSEATHIYDPSITFAEAQRVLRAQWSLAYHIGGLNLRGQKLRKPSYRQIVRAILEHRKRPQADADSD